MTFCNINFNIKNTVDLFERLDENKTKLVIPTNAELIYVANNSKKLYNIVNDNYVTFDGQVPYLAAKTVNRKYKDYNKLPGSHIVYNFCEFAKSHNYRIFFLGGNKENNDSAVKTIKEQYNINVEGYSPFFEDYPFSDQFNNKCLEKINIFKPDILFVGFGLPKQEYWISDQLIFLSNIGIKYAICCGGTIDFVSKRIKRAPVFIQKTGFEWLYRFFKEPKKIRLKRILGAFKFFKYISHKPDFQK